MQPDMTVDDLTKSYAVDTLLELLFNHSMIASDVIKSDAFDTLLSCDSAIQ